MRWTRLSLGLVLLFLSVPAQADIHDEFRACKYEIFPKLRETRGTKASTPVEQFCLGFAYWRVNIGLARDPTRAVQLFRQAAQQGHLGAQTLLGYHYEQGHGVPKNYDEAVRWIKKAADQGYAPAMFHLSRLYTTGKGVTQSESTAQKWFRKAAKGGSADAIIALRDAREYELTNLLAILQAYSAYKEKDYTKAAALYRVAAEAGNAAAQTALGTMLRLGQGVPKNEKEAMRWYWKATDRDYREAQAHLGFVYEMGQGVAPNWREAVKWCTESAAEFNRLGLYCLGRQYQFGIGVPQNREKAVYYFDRANDYGDGQSAWFARWLRVGTNCIGTGMNGNANAPSSSAMSRKASHLPTPKNATHGSPRRLPSYRQKPMRSGEAWISMAKASAGRPEEAGAVAAAWARAAGHSILDNKTVTVAHYGRRDAAAPMIHRS